MIYDVSLPVSKGLVVWPGDPAVCLAQTSHLERGDRLTLTRIEMGAHTGTHVDAPAHFIRGGATVEQLSLDLMVGPAQVVHLPGVVRLTAEVLAGLEIPPGTERLVFRTDNSERWARGAPDFATDYVGVSRDGAHWLVEHGVRLVGIDFLSVAPWDDMEEPHQILLGAGVVVVEGLDLSAVEPGRYQLVCLPLKLAGAEGAPARVILIE